MTDLGLIRDMDNPISKMAKLVGTIIRESYEAQKQGVDITGFTNMGDAHTETGQYETMVLI